MLKFHKAAPWIPVKSEPMDTVHRRLKWQNQSQERLVVYGIDEQTVNTINTKSGGKLNYGFSHLISEIYSSAQKITSDNSQQQQ